jgi:hypothetical protein
MFAPPSRLPRRLRKKISPSARLSCGEHKLDENLPHQLVELLTDLGHDVDAVPAEHLAGRDDDVV